MASKQKLFANEIWKQIEQGEFANGAYLPSERELARKYQLGRITVRLGLKLLLEKHLFYNTRQILLQIIQKEILFLIR